MKECWISNRHLIFIWEILFTRVLSDHKTIKIWNELDFWIMIQNIYSTYWFYTMRKLSKLLWHAISQYSDKYVPLEKPAFFVKILRKISTLLNISSIKCLPPTFSYFLHFFFVILIHLLNSRIPLRIHFILLFFSSCVLGFVFWEQIYDIHS
jgi:hypothetical protein